MKVVMLTEFTFLRAGFHWVSFCLYFSLDSPRAKKKKKENEKSKQFLCQIYKIYSNEGFTLLLHIGQRHITILGSPDGESSDDSLVDLVSIESCSIAELPKHCF